MAIARSRGVLLGTSESSGVSLNNNATVYTLSGSVTTDVDMLGDDLSLADVWLYAAFTSGAAAGTLDITFSSHRLAGQGYLKSQPDYQIPQTGAAQLVPLGKRPCNRYLAVSALNNNSGASITNLAILFELEKLS